MNFDIDFDSKSLISSANIVRLISFIFFFLQIDDEMNLWRELVVEILIIPTIQGVKQNINDTILKYVIIIIGFESSFPLTLTNKSIIYKEKNNKHVIR